MKRTIYVCLLVSISLLVLSLGGCKKDQPKIIKQKVTGYVQKGPYVNGTSITMSELNSSLVQTGKNFTTQISNNSGSFEINNVNLTSSYVEFSANGYYFDEVKGDLSIAPLNLYALSDITDISTVNVNILTHLEKQRVDYLIKQNKTFSEAKKIAQGEILAIFGFSLSEMDNSEELDISVNNEGNAILLAISIILQGNRSVGDLTELLATITNDIREDGILNSESIMTSLRNSTKELVLATIRSNLANRYQVLGINASIPGFEKYINDFLAFTGQKPLATTQAATNITKTSVTLNGVVNANSLSTTVTFEYGTSIDYGNSGTSTQSPVIGNFPVNVSAEITGLSLGTTYHFRVKAVNSLGTTYGTEIEFTSLCPITDIDGNIYNTVNIGTQVWMSENLKTTKYRNGELIGTTTPATKDIFGESTPKYQWAYGGNESNVATYGRLYTWYAVTDSRNVCPTGWHLSSEAEWLTVVDYLGGEDVAGDKMKEAGTTHWKSPNVGATNESGFSALPGGYRGYDNEFGDIGNFGIWWSSTEADNDAWCYQIGYDYSGIYFCNATKKVGFSVRCLRDN
jgi:uncharacterized protein (TIGR02145 family)